MTSPKISVVIPTINRHEILDQTVASLLDQTCTGQEIIVVDQSESAADCTSGPLSDPRVRYFRVSRRGSPRGRNYGIARARAEIVFSGDDDII
ncbi:MAG: glycosyltransferase, partial [Armatimonadetes bacterium]|nr:glycosyltransferase [Armatimonadota bacterium]